MSLSWLWPWRDAPGDDSPLIPRLEKAELSELFRTAGDSQNLAPGKILIEAAKPCGHLYLVESGSLSIERHGAQIGAAGTGEIVGELSFLLGAPAECTVRAKTSAGKAKASPPAGKVRVTALPHRDLLSLLEKKPALGARLFATLAGVIAQKISTTNATRAAPLRHAHALGERLAADGPEYDVQALRSDVGIQKESRLLIVVDGCAIWPS